LAGAGALSVVGCGDQDEPRALGPEDFLLPGEEAPYNAHGEHPELMAVVQLSLDFGQCSGSVFDSGGTADAPAYVLTAGHCIDPDYSPHRVTLEGKAGHVGSATANGFRDTSDAAIELPVAALEYSTMHIVDAAILRLDTTVDQVRQLGIRPFSLAQRAPRRGADMVIAGHPNSGPLRVAHCQRGASTWVAEDVFWFSGVDNTCPGIAPGSSGSPVLDADGALWGVLSTASGQAGPCTLDNPCDLSQPGLVNPEQQHNYGPDLSGLGGCFEEGSFDVTLEACPLPPVSAPNLPTKPRYARSTQAEPGQWKVDLSQLEAPYYRYLVGDAHATRCDDLEHYSVPLALTEAGTIDVRLPKQEGMQLLCVQPSQDGLSFGKWQSAAALLMQVDNTPPPPPYIGMFVEAGTVTVQPDTFEPDSARIYYRLQPENEHDCAWHGDELAFDGDLRVPAKPRQTLCVTGEDSAGNRSEPTRYLIGE
jgi:V8-like Glu-specific endopeptidase